MPSLARKNAVRLGLSGRQISVIALAISFPVIGLDLVLRTAPGRLSTQPYELAGRWLTDSLIMLPLFAIGVWAADLITGLAGLGTSRRADLLQRALAITLLAAVTQVPAWFVVNKSANPVTAQPLVPPQAHDGGDVYWVPPWVIIALVCVCLATAGGWFARVAARAAARVAARTVGRNVGRGRINRVLLSRTWSRHPRAAATLTNAALLVPLLAVAVLLAWALHQAAQRAYASQVYYTSAPAAVTRHSRVLPAAHQVSRPKTSPVTAAPFAYLYQAAHALQDGLAGQAAGLPAAVIALQRVTRRPDDPNQHQPEEAQGGVS
jgi:hypothetical protein